MDKAIKTLSLLAPILIGLGILKQSIYYWFFGVNIIEFIDLSEAIVLFMNDIYFLILFAVFATFYNVLLLTKKEIGRQWEQHELFHEETTLKGKIKVWIKLTKGIYFLIAIHLFAWLLIFILKSEFSTSMLIMPIVLFSLSFLLFLIKLLIHDIQYKLEMSIHPNTYNIALYFLILIIMIGNNLRYEISSVMNSKSTYGTEIIIEENGEYITHVSDSLDYYIGKTANYTFIYHELEEKTSIIPNHRIYQITTSPTKDETD